MFRMTHTNLKTQDPMTSTTITDQYYLSQALTQAQIRRGFCSPNPSVGAIITQDNKIIATGYHLAAGSPHAEVDALKKLTTPLKNATLYVTLEPCSHWGKTPPCTDAIIQSGIKRVVYGYTDPNTTVAGKGAFLLHTNGITCDYLPSKEITDFYQSYTHWLKTKTPFITAKIAFTLDGKIAGPQGQRTQITGDALQSYTHTARKKSDAILTTIKTILHDDPQLNIRIDNETISKPIYILDSELNLPHTATLFKTAKSLTVFHSKQANSDRIQQFNQLGIRTIAINTTTNGLDLTPVIHHIGQDGIHDLWIEAGGTCFASFMSQKLLQRALIYIAPRWLGEGQTAFPIHFTLDTINAKIQWQQLGNDALCDIRW